LRFCQDQRRTGSRLVSMSRSQRARRWPKPIPRFPIRGRRTALRRSSLRAREGRGASSHSRHRGRTWGRGQPSAGTVRPRNVCKDGADDVPYRMAHSSSCSTDRRRDHAAGDEKPVAVRGRRHRGRSASRQVAAGRTSRGRSALSPGPPSSVRPGVGSGRSRSKPPLPPLIHRRGRRRASARPSVPRSGGLASKRSERQS